MLTMDLVYFLTALSVLMQLFRKKKKIMQCPLPPSSLEHSLPSPLQILSHSTFRTSLWDRNNFYSYCIYKETQAQEVKQLPKVT